MVKSKDDNKKKKEERLTPEMEQALLVLAQNHTHERNRFFFYTRHLKKK